MLCGVPASLFVKWIVSVPLAGSVSVVVLNARFCALMSTGPDGAPPPGDGAPPLGCPPPLGGCAPPLGCAPPEGAPPLVPPPGAGAPPPAATTSSPVIVVGWTSQWK